MAFAYKYYAKMKKRPILGSFSNKDTPLAPGG